MNKKQVLYWAQKMMGAILIISYLCAVFAVIGTSLVPGKYLLFVILVPGVLVTALTYLQFKKKLSRSKNIALSVLMIAANVYVYSVSSATSSFLNTIQDDGYTYEEYSIIAKKDRHITLATDNTLRTALLKTDTHADLVKTEVNNRTKTGYTTYDELTSLTLSIDNHTTDIAALKSSYVQLLKENTPSFYQSIETLATFTIKVKKDTNTAKTDTAKPFVVYISGIDTYGAINAVSRSDVNILAIVNPQTHKILLVNTPRDYYVQLHGTTGVRDKLTHAGIYGIDMSVNTLEDLYGINIDYYMRVNFASLLNIVDALDGVNVFSDYTFKSSHYSFETGYNQLDGKQALEFSRTRYAFEDGDRTRGKNQQRVIEAIIHKLNNPKTLVNYQAIIKSLETTFQTNASSNEITTVMNQQLDSMRGWQTESISVDGTGTTASTYSMGTMPLYVMEPDQTSLTNAKQKIQQYR